MGTMHPLPDPRGELPLVLVTWRDAHFDFERDDAALARADYLVRTVGFLLADGPRFLSVAQELLPHGEGYRAVTHVPCAVVESVVPLSSGGLAAAGSAV